MAITSDINLREDLLFKMAVGSLWLCGVVYILLGAFIPVLFIEDFMDDIASSRAMVFGAIWIISFLISLACALGNFVVAWALQKRKSWGWVAAIIVGAIYAPSTCLPFGVLILVAMLRSGVRDAYIREGAKTL